MSKDKEGLKNVGKYLSSLEKRMETEVLIGFKGDDKTMYNVLNDLVRSSMDYEEIKNEKITYSSTPNETGKRRRYKKIYQNFKEEYYDIIIEKSMQRNTTIVLLDDTKYKGQLHIEAYYFRDNSRDR
jgi:hypothetical protein